MHHAGRYGMFSICLMLNYQVDDVKPADEILMSISLMLVELYYNTSCQWLGSHGDDIKPSDKTVVSKCTFDVSIYSAITVWILGCHVDDIKLVDETVISSIECDNLCVTAQEGGVNFKRDGPVHVGLSSALVTSTHFSHASY